MKPNISEFPTWHDPHFPSEFVTVTKAQKYLQKLFTLSVKKNNFSGVLPIRISSWGIDNGQKWAVCLTFREPQFHNAFFRCLAKHGVPGTFCNVVTMVRAYLAKMDTPATTSDASNNSSKNPDLLVPTYRVWQARLPWNHNFDVSREAENEVYLYPLDTCLMKNGFNLKVGECFTSDCFDTVLNVIYNSGLRS